MTLRLFANLLGAALLGAVLVLAGCASDRMRPMNDSMDSTMMHESSEDSMSGAMMKESDDGDAGMRPSM